MIKERLEEIKDLLRLTKKENFVEDYYVLIKLFEYGHADWLIQQVERVQELEETVEDYKSVNKELHQRGRKVRKQNKRFREALEEIAESRITIADSFGNIRIAKQALEKEE